MMSGNPAALELYVAIKCAEVSGAHRLTVAVECGEAENDQHTGPALQRGHHLSGDAQDIACARHAIKQEVVLRVHQTRIDRRQARALAQLPRCWPFVAHREKRMREM